MKRELCKSTFVLLIAAALFISILMTLPISPAAATATLLKLEARPAVISAPAAGADVAIEIWATNVSADWNIIGFQFDVPYETDLLKPANYSNGNFMEAFVHDEEVGPLYAVSDISRAPNWNDTMAMVMILPNPNAPTYADLYSAPFPSGEGRLITLHYTALAPIKQMPIDITDILILDKNYAEVPYQPLTISAKIEFAPELNWWSKWMRECDHNWITAFISFPDGHNVSDVDVSSIMLNGTIPVDPTAPTEIIGYDGHCHVHHCYNGHCYGPSLMVEFNRTEVSQFVLSKGIKRGKVTLTLTGKFIYGPTFEGSDVIWVHKWGDINMDGRVDMRDLSLADQSFQSCLGDPRWNAMADENGDGIIDMRDIGIIARNFGNTYP
jgi:hypothetical protein